MGFEKIFLSNLYHGRLADCETRILLSNQSEKSFIIRTDEENQLVLSTSHYICREVVTYGITYEIRVSNSYIYIRKPNLEDV